MSAHEGAAVSAAVRPLVPNGFPSLKGMLAAGHDCVAFLLRKLGPRFLPAMGWGGVFFGLVLRDIRKLAAIDVISVNELKIALNRLDKRPLHGWPDASWR